MRYRLMLMLGLLVAAPLAAAEQTPAEKERMELWGKCAVAAIMEADKIEATKQSPNPDNILNAARFACNRHWTADPSIAERIYLKIMASVRTGAEERRHSTSPPVPRESRF